MEIYLKVKTMLGKILQIYSDANSCYDVAFRKLKVQESSFMSKRKKEKHLIESSNGSIRDNLVKFIFL